MLIDAPKVKFPQVFEVYDPQVSDNLNRTSNGGSGSRTFEWVIIPRTQGNYEIPAVDFQYFDPNTGRYVTKSVESVPVRVNRGDPNAMKNVTSNKSDIQLLNSDINYIHTRPSALVPKGEGGRTPLWFPVCCLVIALAGGVLRFLLQRRQKRMKDVAGMRLSRATKEARKRLKKASWDQT